MNILKNIWFNIIGFLLFIIGILFAVVKVKSGKLEKAKEKIVVEEKLNEIEDEQEKEEKIVLISEGEKIENIISDKSGKSNADRINGL